MAILKYFNQQTQEWESVSLGQQGIQGPEGPPGVAGASAYEAAVLDGFVGTEQEWLDSLKGDLTAAEVKTRYESNVNTNAFTDVEKIKLTTIEDNAQANVQADWTAVSGDSFIQNKPNLATVATSGLYSDLSGKPTLGTAAAQNTDYFASSAQGAAADTALQPEDIGVTVQGYSADTVIDANYVATEESYTTVEKSKLAGIEGGAQVNVATDLSYTAASRLIISSTGTDATLPEVVASGNSGLMTGADKNKLDGIEPGAEATWIVTEIKTGNYTANHKEKVPCDTVTLNAPFNVTLPAIGSQAFVFDAVGVNGTGGFAANSVTVLPSAGTTVMGDTSFELDLAGSAFEFELISTDWRVSAGIVPIQEQYFGGDYSQLTGKPTLGTAAATAITDYATAAQGTLADTALQSAALNNTALTGIPTAPTAAEGTNTTQIATTAFVLANSSNGGLSVAYHNTATLSPAVNTIYLIDTTSTAVVITLPDTPANYSRVRLCDYLGNFGTNNATINRSGTNTIADGVFTQLTLSTDFSYVELTYYNGNWSITGDNSFVDELNPKPVTDGIQTVTYNDGGNSTMSNGTYNVFSLAANGTGTTIVHSDVPATGRYAFELHLDWTTGTITWPASWTDGDNPPTVIGNYILTGITINGGTSFTITVVVK